MIVHTNIADLPLFKNACITIGTFDGVHTGHQQIIQLMNTTAAAADGETVIITFHPHPRKIVGNTEAPLYLLNTLEEKITLLDKYGIHHLVVVPFNEAFANQSAEEYISDFLVHTFRPHTIIIGHDHRFGKGRGGDFQLLEDMAGNFGYQVKEIPGFMLQNMTISSTKIREALLSGDVDTAKQCLGYDYFFSGTVIQGNQLGRTLGFPTANLLVNDAYKLVPANGVYAVTATRKTKSVLFKGIMNIGIRPTVNGTTRSIEVNLFDFDETIYEEVLTVQVHQHLRSEVKFAGLPELKVQLARDRQNALDALVHML